MYRTILLPLTIALAACGGNSLHPEVPSAPTTTSATATATVTESETTTAATSSTEATTPATAATATSATSATSATTPAEPTAEKCDGGWVCVKVSFDTRKVEKRDTKLLGDPKIESTWSKNSDGRPATFDAFSKGAVELTLRRKPNHKNEVVLKSAKGGEIVIDRRDGSPDDFTHVGAIAAEQDGAFLVDIKYSR